MCVNLTRFSLSRASINIEAQNNFTPRADKKANLSSGRQKFTSLNESLK